MVTTCDRGYLCHIASPSIHPPKMASKPWNRMASRRYTRDLLVKPTGLISMRSPSSNAIKITKAMYLYSKRPPSLITRVPFRDVTMGRHFVHKNQLKISSSLPPVIDGAIFLQAINPMMHFRSLKTIYQI